MFSFSKDDFANRFSNTTDFENNEGENKKNAPPDYLKNRQIYSKTILVGGFETKQTQENLEFLLGKNTLIDDNPELANDNKRDSLLNL
jgi:hypothetical protein